MSIIRPVIVGAALLIGAAAAAAQESSGIDPEALIERILATDQFQREHLEDVTYSTEYIEREDKGDRGLVEKVRLVKEVYVKYLDDTAWFAERYLEYFKEVARILAEFPLMGWSCETCLGYLDDEELLKLLEGKYPLGLASSSVRKNIDECLAMLDMTKYFKVILSAADIPRNKPFPDVYLLAAEKLGVDPAECAVIEDADSGVIAGKSAGMKVIAVPNEFTAHMDFSPADVVVDSLSEITIDMIEGL